ncbi:MAG: pseudouridine synthase [bacterium]|nr:pseudouridine synthase [bacterium]
MERIHKFIARAGVVSRRKAEELIAAGRVTVNGRRAAIGMSVDPVTDVVEVSGKRVVLPQSYTYLLFHKPAGFVTTRSDERGRQTIYDLLPKQYHTLRYAGRLDKDSEGLLLLTDDGDFIERLMHPRNRVEKEYVVYPASRPTYGQIAALRGGAMVHGKRHARPDRVTTIGGNVHVIVREGAKREVRSLCASAGIDVARLVRIRIGTIMLPSDLAPGKWRITQREHLLEHE